MEAVKKISVLLLLVCSQSLWAAGEEGRDKATADSEIPRIVLHDILTNRVCINESKLYSIGAKIIILGQRHECKNVSPMTFGSDADWDMQWVPVEK